MQNAQLYGFFISIFFCLLMWTCICAKWYSQYSVCILSTLNVVWMYCFQLYCWNKLTLIPIPPFLVFPAATDFEATTGCRGGDRVLKLDDYILAGTIRPSTVGPFCLAEFSSMYNYKAYDVTAQLLTHWGKESLDEGAVGITYNGHFVILGPSGNTSFVLFR